MKISTGLIFLAILIGILAFIPPPSHLLKAQVGEAFGGSQGKQLFGGKIQQVRFCTCYYAPYIWLRIGPPTPNDVVIVPFLSLQYRNWSYREGNWALGDAWPFRLDCMDTAGFVCKQNGYSGYAVFHIGTSAGSDSFEAP